MPRAKKHLQSKEEVVRATEVARKRKLVTEQFYPALVASTVSVDEAKMLIQSMSSLIMEDVMRTMQDRKFSEITDKMLKRLCPDGARAKEVLALLGTLDGENLFIAREVVEGMTNAINQMIQDEMQNRTLNSFEPDWERMMNK